MRVVTLAVLVGALVIATSVSGLCQTPRSLAMGLANGAIADDAAAWLFNPAGLARANIMPREGQDVVWQGILGMDVDSDLGLDEEFGHLAAKAGNQGFAVGRLRDKDIGGAVTGGGYGFSLGSKWDAGAAIVHTAAANWSQTYADAGLMYNWTLGGAPAKLSLLCTDVFDKAQRLYHAGVSAYIGDRLLLDVDVLDLDDKTNVPGVDKSGTMINIGAEFALTSDLKLRAGSQDGDFGFGAGYAWGDGWAVDVGYIKFKDVVAGGFVFAANGEPEPGDFKTTLVSLSKDF